jgi:hypothetical protein
MNKYKKFLLHTVETRFKTIMIGSLARIEDYFGYLWGHGKDELTDRQKEFKNLWDELRNEILNHGNFHIRKGLDEVEDVLEANNNRYEYKFYVEDQQRRSEDGQ